MALKEKLSFDLRDALRKGDKTRCLVIRMLLADINNTEIEKQHPLDDGEILCCLWPKEIKQHKESIEAFTKGKRPDLVAIEEAELAILTEYMPEALSREEIVTLASKVIKETGACGIKDKGKVMSKVIAQTKGRADGAEVNAIVTELLTKSTL